MKTGRDFLESHQNKRKADDWTSGTGVEGYTEFPDATGAGSIGIRGTGERETDLASRDHDSTTN